VVVGVLTVVWYVWCFSSSRFSFELIKPEQASQMYNLLADGFLSGHLHFNVAPPAQLLALPDPYDPHANGAYRLHDASLYDGRYYCYFGPAPVLLLYLPVRVLTGRFLSDATALATFLALGLLFQALCLRALLLRRRLGGWEWGFVGGMLAVAVSNVGPFLARRPAMYEVAITAGYAFASLALYSYLRGSEPAGKRRWFFVMSVALGFAMASRPTYVLFAAVFALAVVRREWSANEPSWWRRAALYLSPAAAMGLALLWYNWARFGNPLEFGTRYVLAGVNMHRAPMLATVHFLPNLRYYTFAAPRLVPFFPYLVLQPERPGLSPTPGLEPVAGIFLIFPICWFFWAGLGVLHKRTRILGTEAWLCAALGAVMAIPPLLAPGATFRYLTDFAPWIVLAAIIAWADLWLALPWSGARRVVTVTGVAAAFAGIVVMWPIGLVGYYGSFEANNPRDFRALSCACSLAQARVLRVVGAEVQPELARIIEGCRR
jgi:hypothetical protein